MNELPAVNTSGAAYAPARRSPRHRDSAFRKQAFVLCGIPHFLLQKALFRMKSPIAENLGEQIRRARTSRKLTQPDLAARLGRDRARISELERDLLNTRIGRDRLALLLEICDALDLAPMLVPTERLKAVRDALAAPGGDARPGHASSTFDDVFVDLSDEDDA